MCRSVLYDDVDVLSKDSHHPSAEDLSRHFAALDVLFYASEEIIAGIKCRILVGIRDPCAKHVGSGLVTKYKCLHYHITWIAIVLASTLPKHT